METTRIFRSVFGSKYELKILPEEQIEGIIQDLDGADILQGLVEKHVGDYTYAYLNVSTGEIEYYSFIGNTDLQEKEHLILIDSISGNLEEGLEIEDFLSDDEMEAMGIHEDDVQHGAVWGTIRALNDYQERLIEAWKFYYNGLNMEMINAEVDKIYHPGF